MNHSREYWYMGSMLERSVVQKKRSCVRTAIGMYSLRVTSISHSVCSVSTTLACGEEGGKNGWKGRGWNLIADVIPETGLAACTCLRFEIVLKMVQLAVTQTYLVKSSVLHLLSLFFLPPFFS